VSSLGFTIVRVVLSLSLLLAFPFAAKALVEVGRSAGQGYVLDIAADGNHAFIAEDRSASVPESALRIVDITDPAAPLEVGEIVFSGERMADRLAVTQVSVFVGASFWEWDEELQSFLLRSEVQVFERVTPSTLTPRSVVALDGEVRGLDAAGSSLFTIESGSTLRIFDASNLTAVAPTGSLALNADVHHVHVEGAIALLSEAKTHLFPANPPGLRIIDVSNPVTPSEIGFAELPNDARSVDVGGTTAVVVLRDATYCCAEGIHTVDLSNPSDPQPLTRLILGGYPTDVRMSGSLAFVSNGNQEGTYVIDVANPGSPEIISDFLPDATSSALELVAGTALLAAGDDLALIDLQDVTRPLAISNSVTPGDADAVRVQDGVAYVADGEEGLRILDVSNPFATVLLGSLATTGRTRSLLLDGPIAYLADGDAGVRIVDVSDPTSPVVLGNLDTPGHAAALGLSGNRLYVADQVGGLRIVEVSDPTQPVELGSVATGETTRGVDVVGELAYMADGGAGLRVIDASNPTLPVEIGVLDPPNPSTVYDVQVVDDLAYVADSNGMRVVDVSIQPPVELNVVEPGAYEVEILNQNRMVTANFKGVRVFDLSTPESPRYMGGTPVVLGLYNKGARSIDVEAGLVYATWDADGIEEKIGVVDFGPQYGLGAVPVASLSAFASALLTLTVSVIGWTRSRRHHERSAEPSRAGVPKIVSPAVRRCERADRRDRA
jgi:hypothetical protein